MIIKNGRVINPSNNMDEIKNIFIKDGIITEISDRKVDDDETEIIDAKGLLVFPGLIDLHVHFRDPGQTYKEDLVSGAFAAAKGGFTTVCAMPNTVPTVDNVEIFSNLINRSKELPTNIIPVASITLGLEGKQLTDMKSLSEAGAICFSDDGKSVMDVNLYKQALINAKEQNVLIMAHCEEKNLVNGGVMNEGEKSKKLNLPGITNSVEDIITARDLLLANEIGVRIHLCHCSTKLSMKLKEMLRLGNISAETCPHYFTLSDEDILEDNANFKMNPPLRSKEDKDAIIEGISKGIIDAISTDHAPHSDEEKQGSMMNSPFGIVGLETSVALTISELVKKGIIDYIKMAELMSFNPARILGIDKGSIDVGKIADITIINPDEEWVIDKNKFASKSHNTPFDGRKVTGKVKYTINNGRVVYKDK